MSSTQLILFYAEAGLLVLVLLLALILIISGRTPGKLPRFLRWIPGLATIRWWVHPTFRVGCAGVNEDVRPATNFRNRLTGLKT